MKTLLLACLLLSTQAMAAPGAYVFGDSLTSPMDSWAGQLNRAGLANLQINAVPGRRLIDLQIPTDLRPTPEISMVIFHIGSNNAGQAVPVDEFRDHYQTLILSINPRLDIYCVLPPFNDWDTPVAAYREAAREICPNVIDVPTGLYSDGIHMTRAGHFWHAAGILQALEN